MARGLCYDSIQKERPVPGGELSPDGSVSICLTHILPTECLAAGVSFFWWGKCGGVSFFVGEMRPEHAETFSAAQKISSNFA